MTGLRQRLDEHEPRDRLRLPPDALDADETGLRVDERGLDAQPPTVGQRQPVALGEAHGPQGMALHRGRQRDRPPHVETIAVHRHIIGVRVEKEYRISHGYKATTSPQTQATRHDLASSEKNRYSVYSLSENDTCPGGGMVDAQA